jgi:hypothetical protein
MNHNRRRTDRAQPSDRAQTSDTARPVDDGSGRIALIGMLVVLALLLGAVQFIN